MHSNSYNESMMDLFTIEEILEIPRKNKWNGADITMFINDVYLQYDYVTRTDSLKTGLSEEKFYSDILSKLVKNYGH
jgi:hypothetical protein